MQLGIRMNKVRLHFCWISFHQRDIVGRFAFL
jgi:hypothetical protein